MRIFTKKLFTVSTILGILVIPPTRTTSFISAALNQHHLTLYEGSKVLSTNLSTRASSLALVNFKLICFGPVLSAVIGQINLFAQNLKVLF